MLSSNNSVGNKTEKPTRLKGMFLIPAAAGSSLAMRVADPLEASESAKTLAPRDAAVAPPPPLPSFPTVGASSYQRQGSWARGRNRLEE